MKEQEKTPEEILVPTLEVETVTGEKLRVPKTTLEKEIEISRVLAKILKEIYSLEVVKKGQFEAKDLLSVLPELLQKCPSDVVKVASIIIEKDEGWVVKNLEIEGLVKLLTPFSLKLKKLLKGLPGVVRSRVSTK